MESEFYHLLFPEKSSRHNVFIHYAKKIPCRLGDGGHGVSIFYAVGQVKLLFTILYSQLIIGGFYYGKNIDFHVR